MFRVQVCLMERKFADALTTLKQAKEAAPDSPAVKQIDNFIIQFTKVNEAQQEAAKLESGLDKSEGLDRAKLLDKLVGAKEKLMQFDPQAGADIKKWSKEIVTLDPDNKAGLKKKYEFKSVMADAMALMQAGKADEANSVLDKAIETAGGKGEDAQQAQFFKAQIALMHRNNKQGIACLKKALDAAPEGKLAPTIKGMLSRMQKTAAGGDEE